MVNGLLWSPILVCLKMMGPGLESFVPIAAISMTGENRTMSRSDPMMSNSLFIAQLSVLVSGTYRMLMTGRPIRSSV